MTPQTIEEWKRYISALTEERLVVEARTANSVAFLRVMTEEGNTPETFSKVLNMFAQELHKRDLPLTDRGPGQMASYYRMVHGYPKGK